VPEERLEQDGPGLGDHGCRQHGGRSWSAILV
jgi:hypothetical protein